MKRILEISGKKNIHQVWPNLELYIHGGMNFSPYKKSFEQIFPNPQMNYVEAYNSSEGYFGLQDQVNSKDLLLLCDSHIYFEFIPMSEFDGLNSKNVLSLNQVELNTEYAMVISTSAGLWRYIIGDTLIFVEKKPYRFQISGRTTQFINAFGEKLLMIHAEKAIAKTAETHGVIINDYTAAPSFINDSINGYHEWAIAFQKPPKDINAFSKDLDLALMQVNGDYEGKRKKSLNMNPPLIRIVKPDVFEKWLKSKGKLGGQHKIPRLKKNRLFLEEILFLNET